MITETQETRGGAQAGGSLEVVPRRPAQPEEPLGVDPPGPAQAAKSWGVAPTGPAQAGESWGVAPSGPVQALQGYLNRLRGLAEVLTRHGLRASVMAPPGRVPSVHVVNPAASVLAEDVYTGRGPDGTWWFWWSWAERIASGEDLEGAAAMIKQVLAARDEDPR
jgi:hypothetical protein